jgi:ABC-type antimicrobial peptide transport system permease subunit
MPKNEDSDVELAKKIAQVAKIRRKENLDAFKDYIGFVINLLFGLASLIGGMIGEFFPAILPSNINNPRMYIGLGLALLVGKGAVTIIAKLANALKS